jgi:small basic protein
VIDNKFALYIFFSGFLFGIIFLAELMIWTGRH